jgi:methylthioribulose-1-phosphate dehydratase
VYRYVGSNFITTKSSSLPEEQKKNVPSKKRKRGYGGARRADPLGGKFAEAAKRLVEIGKGFYARGWVLGTSGNFSAVVSQEPLRLAITSTGLDKGSLTPAQFLEIDEGTNVVRGDGRPSAEALLHLAVVRGVAAAAVLHTHSVWSTVLSGTHARHGGIALEGYEMLKGLAGVATHKHREWLPILENSQDMAELADHVSRTLEQTPGIHGFLLQEHGLYTWGVSLEEAKRHVEILEFLMEVLVRSGAAQSA